MSNDKRIVAQLQVDVLHSISNGNVEILKPLIVHIGEHGNVQIIVLTGPLRIGGKQIYLDPIVELLQRPSELFQYVCFRGRLHDSTILSGTVKATDLYAGIRETFEIPDVILIDARND